MKKAFRIIGRILFAVFAVMVFVLLGIFVYNRIRLASEKKLLADQQISQMVEVDGHKMSVYVSGEGNHTLVFMAGAGVPCPILDFKPFMSRFDDDYRTVCIEKFGYGFSDEADGPRDVETRVSQDRKALEAAGISGPYILCPHSYSGLEAIYWAQNFPDEIEAIVGLDMAVPGSYDLYNEESISSIQSADTVNRVLRDLGIIRLFARGALPDDFSDEEKIIATALICKGYRNKTLSSEADSILHDVGVVDSRPIPDVPTLLIISDGSVTDGWIDCEMKYASGLSDVTVHQLDCGHSVYDYEPDQCENAMREFIGRFITWRPMQPLYVSASLGGVAYPRMLTLENGTILCAFDGNDTKGGNSVIKVYQSKDGGKTWGPTNKDNDNSVMQPSDQYIYANPNMMQLKNGDVLIAYRGLSSDDGGSPRDSGIFVSVSHDNGITWQPHSTVIKYDQHIGGVYEPILVEIKGVPTAFYANDTVQGEGETTGVGMVDTAYLAAVPSWSYQNIEYMQLIDGEWGNRTIVCNGVNSNSRDGMPGLTQLADGRWMLAFEASNTGERYSFVLRYKLSDDGLHWNTDRGTGNGTVLCVPSTKGRKTAAPALAALPDGRIVCVFQTDDGAAEKGDERSRVRMMISETADPSDGWGDWFDVFDTPDGNYSLWNGCGISHDQLFVLTSTNYPSNSVYLRRAALG
ncbi:MAG: hypothetical protein K6C08_03540 [Oscillospiraceae bacterium]|nr:hypothetical protein [Oscillospiraceae bacterium]